MVVESQAVFTFAFPMLPKSGYQALIRDHRAHRGLALSAQPPHEHRYDVHPRALTELAFGIALALAVRFVPSLAFLHNYA